MHCAECREEFSYGLYQEFYEHADRLPCGCELQNARMDESEEEPQVINCPNHGTDTEVTVGLDTLNREAAVRTCRACGEACGTLRLTAVDSITDTLNRLYAECQGWKKEEAHV